MRTVSEISAWMERFAPKRLAESWDNVGLLLGDPSARVERVMTCLTVTPESASEAIDESAGLIVSHHPILFRPTQQIRADRSDSAPVWNLARAGVAVYSPHTAFDNTEGGINDGLARRLRLDAVKSLRPPPPSPRFKVVVFTPQSDREAVLNAAFSAGAGRIGDYQECSFSTGGHGTFFGTEGTEPTVGEAGRRERVREWKVEFVCPGDRLARSWPMSASIIPMRSRRSTSSRSTRGRRGPESGGSAGCPGRRPWGSSPRTSASPCGALPRPRSWATRRGGSSAWRSPAGRATTS